MIVTELEKQIVDTDLLRQRFRCATKTYNKHAVVQKDMARCLVEMAQDILPARQNKMLELGCGTGLLTQEITAQFNCDKYVANDLVAEVEEEVSSIVKGRGKCDFEFIQGDLQFMNMPEKQDVIWSGATIQWIEDLDTFFKKLSLALNKEGYVALSSFDTENYKEVRALTGKGIEYKSMEEVLCYASNYFKVLDCKSWYQQLWFENPKDVLKHMRFTGVNGVAKTKWGKGDLEHFNKQYEMFRTERGYPLTYHPFVFVLQKRI